MIIVYDKAGVAKVIRPCPLMSINWNAESNESGQLGGSYSITLNGTIIAFEGSPFIANVNLSSSPANFANQYDPRPTGQNIPESGRLGSILSKQMALRNLFADQCNLVEVLSIDGNEPIIKFYPKLTSMSFEEGVWFDTCAYSINLETDFLLDKDERIIAIDSYNKQFLAGADQTQIGSSNVGLTINEYTEKYGGLVSDFTESWTLEPEDGNSNIIPYSAAGNQNYPYQQTLRTYRLSRNLSATGKKTLPNCQGNTEPHTQARGFLKKYLDKQSNHSADGYHTSGNSLNQYFASGFIDLSANLYKGYNHSRSESYDKTAGSYSINDTWILSSGTAFENYSASVSDNISESTKSLSINGSIKGLSSIPASGTIFGGNFPSADKTPYQNAIEKYNLLSNNGNFGISSDLYKRARNLVTFDLHPVPRSVSLGLNEFTGEVTYNLEFDNRPVSSGLTAIASILSENVSINDTYPGDVFATIPVLGRTTGPVLQYLGTRTEYRRDFSLELVIDMAQLFPTTTTTTLVPTTFDPNANSTSTTTTTTRPPLQSFEFYRNRYVLSKPSLWEPARSEINKLIMSVSPAFEQGIRKYFLNPPLESWDPQSGSYKLSLTWTYELNR